MQPQSNLDVITDLMIWGNPMKQMVIMDAIMKYVDMVAAAGREETRKAFGENHFINPDAWFNSCAEIKAKMDAHLNPSPAPHVEDAAHYVDVITDGDGITRPLSRSIRLL